jgi:hypothetical protein
MKALPRRIGELEERHDRWLQAKQCEREHAAYMRAVRHAQRLERRRRQRREMAAERKAEALRKAEAERQAELAAISAHEAEERKAADVAQKLAAGNAGETCREEAQASTVDARTSWMEEHCRWLPLHERARFE